MHRKEFSFLFGWWPAGRVCVCVADFSSGWLNTQIYARIQAQQRLSCHRYGLNAMLRLLNAFYTLNTSYFPFICVKFCVFFTKLDWDIETHTRHTIRLFYYFFFSLLKVVCKWQQTGGIFAEWIFLWDVWQLLESDLVLHVCAGKTI